MCGIIGILANSPVNHALYDGLTMIQHRGQDAAGMMTWDESDTLHLRKSNGLVRDVFHANHMLRLMGNMGIGHVLYPTAGTQSAAEAQPFYVNSPYGLSIVHNGNLINSEALTKDLIKTDLRHLNTQSDSEVMLNVFAHELQQTANAHLKPEHIFAAVRKLHQRCLGGYAVIIMIAGHGLLAIRDTYGIRPLVFGKRKTEKGFEAMFASETVALNVLGYELDGDVAPGEAIYVDLKGKVHRQQCADNPQLCPCLFEYVYLARPDSMMSGISVYKARLKMGEKLAEKILKLRPNHDIDVVVPIPDTSRTAALPLAHLLGVKYREGFIKNRYIGRTFIMPGQGERKKSVRQKLNAISLEFKGKNVMLVDDSIVRGTTSREIIQMAREAGAKKVYFASAAPEVRYPNVYGIDIPTPNELVANGRTTEEVCEFIGADWLIYQDLEDLYTAVREGNSEIKCFEDAVFSGHYITGNVDRKYLEQLRKRRNEHRGVNSMEDKQVVEIYNSTN